MKDELAENPILEKINEFEIFLLGKRKEEIKELLIKKDTSLVQKIIYLANSISFGIAFGKLMSAFILTEVHMGFIYGLFLTVLSVINFAYLNAYVNKNQKKIKIHHELEKQETIKELKDYLTIVSIKYWYKELLLNTENIDLLRDNNNVITNEDMKFLINSLNTEELQTIIQVLKKHSQKHGFSINLITDLRKLFKVEKDSKRKEKILIENLKDIRNESFDKDVLLEEMQKEIKSEQNFKKEKKINFKDKL